MPDEGAAPAEGLADPGRHRQAEHRGQRPAEEDEGDRPGRAARAATMQADRGGGLRREHGGAEHGQRAQRQQRRVARHQRAQSAWPTAYRAASRRAAGAGRSPTTQPASSGAPKHIDRGADGDQLAGQRRPRPAATALRSLSVPGTTITPQPMTKLPNSSAQRTGRAARRDRRGAGRRHRWPCVIDGPAALPGLTMLVGLPPMKLTTLSKAASKYIS